MTLITVATCQLNQWAMDFDGNLERIYQSCIEAQKYGAYYRLGPELEICGYGCEDHYYEYDTYIHCWESLIILLERGVTDNNMICDFGMPIYYNGVRYNCRIICHNRKILLIRPKTSMADDGNYRESRYFTAYIPYNNNNNTNKDNNIFVLPIEFQNKFQQETVPFGIHYISCIDDNNITIGYESCEELWTPFATHINLSLHGVDMICNSSASHHVLRKLNTRLDLILNATKKCGGIYMYSNQIGCDGNRVYYDGCALIVCNGIVLAQGSQFSIKDVEVITATIDLNDVRSYRASLPSLGIQSQLIQQQSNHKLSYISCFKGTIESSSTLNRTTLISSSLSSKYHPYPITKPINHGEVRIHDPEEECCLGPACWLWDYLRRSGATGFFLPLSGGADSTSVAAIVSVMCQLVTTAVHDDPNGITAQEVRRIVGDDTTKSNDQWIPQSSQELCQHILHTTYMGTTNSSDVTKSRAKQLGDAIGSYHLSITIDTIITSILSVFTFVTGKVPQFVSNGGSTVEDLALQNIQARIRMVLSYLFAQLLPWVRGKHGFLLVLSSSNVDEGLRGYMTKYDCSSGDLNPIGAISKVDLKKMLLYISNKYPILHNILYEIATAPPTAELRPIVYNNTSDNDDDSNDATKTTTEHSQLDEEEMGMTYEELGVFGTLRKLSRCGPVSMYLKLCSLWSHLQPNEIGIKVKRFFYYYSVNRHKMCTITPSYHAEGYSPDDNRFDLRQFLYNVKWPRQFMQIDKLVKDAEERTTNNNNI